MLSFAKFDQGLTYNDFLARYANEGQKERWRQVHAQVALTPAQRQLLAVFRRQMNVLCLAGAWCGDCINQCPIYEHFAAAAPVIRVRYLDRDEHADVQQELQINAGKRVPVHVKIHTGMSRYGVRWDEALSLIELICAEKSLLLEGAMTHFAQSDETEKTFANLQISRFDEVMTGFGRTGEAPQTSTASRRVSSEIWIGTYSPSIWPSICAGPSKLSWPLLLVCESRYVRVSIDWDMPEKRESRAW